MFGTLVLITWILGLIWVVFEIFTAQELDYYERRNRKYKHEYKYRR